LQKSSQRTTFGFAQSFAAHRRAPRDRRWKERPRCMQGRFYGIGSSTQETPIAITPRLSMEAQTPPPALGRIRVKQELNEFPADRRCDRLQLQCVSICISTNLLRTGAY